MITIILSYSLLFDEVLKFCGAPLSITWFCYNFLCFSWKMKISRIRPNFRVGQVNANTTIDLFCFWSYFLLLLIVKFSCISSRVEYSPKLPLLTQQSLETIVVLWKQAISLWKGMSIGGGGWGWVGRKGLLNSRLSMLQFQGFDWFCQSFH